VTARKQTAAAKRREATRLGNAFANRASELIRAMQLGLNAAAGEILSDEVEEADAFAQDEIAKKVAEFNAAIAQANANTERVEKSWTERHSTLDAKYQVEKSEHKLTREKLDDEREKRIKVEAERDRLNAQLRVVRAQVAQEETN